MAAKRRRTKRGLWDREYSEYYEDESRQTPGSRPASTGRLPPVTKHLLVLGSIALLFLLAIWLVAGRAMLEKTVQAIAAPCGVVWLGLTLSVYFCLLKRQAIPAVLAFVSWLVLTLAGNSLVANWLAFSIEQDYYDFNAEKLPLMDVVLVLGGGTTSDPGGNPQAGFAGDRLLVASRLFRAGKIKQLVCSGTNLIPPPKGELTIALSTARLLTELGVDGDKVVTIGGKNTLEELQAFDRWLAEQTNRNMRVGILTSAWHLNRAQRLASTVGVDATSIPANFISARYQPDPGLLIPTAYNVTRVSLVLKEYFAGLVGR